MRLQICPGKHTGREAGKLLPRKEFHYFHFLAYPLRRSLSIAANSPKSHAAAIHLQNVSKLFGNFAALRQITAEFSAGKLYVLIGENGAGKSTLLRIIAGLARPSFGSVSLLGKCHQQENLGGLLGYMGHSSMLYDELSGLENLKYFFKLYGSCASVSPAAQQPHAPEVPWWRPQNALKAVGLDPHLFRPVGQFSQGMRQRASLARAVQNDPRILLLDEPFANVDDASAQQMLRLIALMRDRGRTILLVTHQPSLTEKIGDEYLMMHAGQIVARDQTLPGVTNFEVHA